MDLQIKQEQARQMRYARSKFRRINSLDLIPEDPSQESSTESQQEDDGNQTVQRRRSVTTKQIPKRAASTATISMKIQKIILFWPNLIMNLFMAVIRYILYIPLSIAAPSFWLSALLWIFWKFLRLPLSVFKWMFNIDSLSITSSSPVSCSSSQTAHKRTILISCGSTIQTLHLARNFYSSGARVIVIEFEGLFGLARFSTAVDKFYVVPRPSVNNVDSYIAALCHIVKKEKPSVYIPVCATSPAYYDSLVKPHLELMGCATFIPGLQETIILDDCLQFYKKCAAQSIPLPPYSVLSSMGDLWHLYESGFISNFRNILMAVGMQGLLERYKYILPNSRRDFKFNHDINECQQWMIVRDLPGEHYVTCTMVKDSRVVGNVTCKVEHDTRNLVPLTTVVSNSNHDPASDEARIDTWLKIFFTRVRFQRSINGHISFRMVKCQSTGQFLPLGVRLGVSLPYICYNRSHAQTLCRSMKCVHMRQLHIGGYEEESAIAAALSGTWLWPGMEKKISSVALDKREALFAYWDPLPYCAYYHFQLPLESVKMFLQKRHRTTKTLSPRITIPVH